MPDHMTPDAAAKLSPILPGAEGERLLAARLREQELRLGEFIRSTEGDFLTIGASLRQFHDQSSDLSRRANSVVALMLGEEIAATVDGLEGLLEQLTVYTRILDQEAEVTEKGLRQVLQMLGKVVEPVAGFRKIVKNMNILGLSTKVENAAHLQEDQSFFILADDLRKLGENIDSQAREILGQLATLTGEVEGALAKVAELRSRQSSKAQKIIANTRSGIATLAERHQISSSSAREVAGLSADINRRVGVVVTSLQFHDLTRQQIEHVMMALRDMASALEKHLRMAAKGEVEGVVETIGEICRLQEAQLGNSRDELVKAVSKIKSNLREIAVSIAAMGRQTHQVAGATDQVGSTFLAEMEHGMAAVAANLEENARANRESTSTIDSLATSVARMGDFLQEIENIGAEMKVLALNAGIKAARVSEGGAGLGVIAGAIQKLSATALLQTTLISRSLRQITEAAKSLSYQDAREREERKSQVEEFLRELQSLLNNLRLLNRDAVSNLVGMEGDGRRLAEAIEVAVAGLTVDGLAARVLTEVTGGLSDIASSRSARPGRAGRLRGTAEESALFGHLLSRYTMHRERSIHQSIAKKGGAKPKEERPASRPEPSRRGSDLGDNVELF